jgi:hypothetical protein
MHRVRLTYTLQGDDAQHADLHHPLLALLAARRGGCRCRTAMSGAS